MTDKNLELWNSVEKTDPKYTKKVTFGRGFTSIDPMYQIMKATKALGPVGKGWAYTVEHSTLEAGGCIMAVADVSISLFDGTTYGPVRGLDFILNNKGRLDEDAPKKAMTDALTKALSHLGIGADVFLGKFDDNRYVAAMEKEFSQPLKAVQGKDKEKVQKYVSELVTAIKENDGSACTKITQKLRDDEAVMNATWNALNSEQKAKVRELIHETSKQKTSEQKTATGE
jgi:hypothetical protein